MAAGRVNADRQPGRQALQALHPRPAQAAGTSWAHNDGALAAQLQRDGHDALGSFLHHQAPNLSRALQARKQGRRQEGQAEGGR